MTISIPFPVPNKGYALNSKLRVNLDAIVDELNRLDSGTSVWEFAQYDYTEPTFGYRTRITISPYLYATYDMGITAECFDALATDFYIKTRNYADTYRGYMGIGMGQWYMSFYDETYGVTTAATIYGPKWTDPEGGSITFNLPTTVASTLSVTGASTLTGKVTLEGSALIWGDVYLRGNLFAQGAPLYHNADYYAKEGTAGGPSFTFTQDTNTGIFLNAQDSLGFSAGGTSRVIFGSTSANFSILGRFPNGDSTTPGISFTGATGNGFYLSSNNINIATNETARWLFSNTTGFLLSGTGGAMDIGNSAQYIGDLSYKTLTDRSGVFFADPLSSYALVKNIAPEETNGKCRLIEKRGHKRLKFSTLKEAAPYMIDLALEPAPEDIVFDDNIKTQIGYETFTKGQVIAKKGEMTRWRVLDEYDVKEKKNKKVLVEAAEGLELTAYVSHLTGAIRHLIAKVEALEAKVGV